LGFSATEKIEAFNKHSIFLDISKYNIEIWEHKRQ